MSCKTSYKVKCDIDPSKSSLSATMELISFRHQYDCRKDPNEPIRGKVSCTNVTTIAVISILPFWCSFMVVLCGN